MSQITTHILDTAKGCPAHGVRIELFHQKINLTWIKLSEGTTNADGRIPNLIPKEAPLDFGLYKMVFYVESYFNACRVQGFYPKVEIEFFIRDESHYHIPLLLSPFGYSTYRGS